MPTWGELIAELNELREIQQKSQSGPAQHPPGTSPHDAFRRKYIARLSDMTGRTTILYYSAWLEKPEAPFNVLSVGTADVAGFMEACSNATDSRDLDLFLHSPGGDPDAAEQICAYLRTQFDHIRAIVPLAAMSAATMIALSADEIVMGDHSQLGPIDPQFTVATAEGPRTASAQAIKDQFEMAKKQCQDPKQLPAWLPILRGLGPGLLAACNHAAQRAEVIVAGALQRYMFKGREDAENAAGEAAKWFGNAEQFLSHGRPVRRDEAREQGIVIRNLEDDQAFQDAVLSVHHAAVITLGQTPTAKLIENERGRAYIKWVVPQVVVRGPQQGQPGQQVPPQQQPKPPSRQAQKRRGKRRT